MDVQDYLSDLTDADLIAKMEEAKEDLANAARDQPNSDWHEACFAGVIIFAQEASKRGIRIGTVH